MSARNQTPVKLGILAGGGFLPKAVIESCQQNKRPYHVIAFKHQTPASLVTGTPHHWVRLGAAGKTVGILHDEGVQELVMAGSIKRPTLAQLRPDLWAMKFFMKTGAATMGDDGILRTLITALEENEGFRVIGAEQFVSHLLIKQGLYSDRTPDKNDENDIKIAIQAALKLGAGDYGQAVVVRDGAVIGEEDSDGTDAMLEKLAIDKNQPPSGVLVKLPKPGQERRADLPAIGPETITKAAQAGLSGIAMEAGGGFLLEQQEALNRLQKSSLFLIGLDQNAAQVKSADD